MASGDTGPRVRSRLCVGNRIALGGAQETAKREPPEREGDQKWW
jgi:hypothetical protein